DDPVVDAAGQFSRQMSGLTFFPEPRNARRRNWRFNRPAESRALWRRLRHKHPHIVVVFFTGVTPGENPIHFEALVRQQRWDEPPLAGVSIELPAVVAALQIVSFEPSEGERHAAVRASIAKRKALAGAVPAKNQWNFQQCGLVQPAAREVCAA